MSGKVLVARKDLKVGQQVWAMVTITKDVINWKEMMKANGGKLSRTARSHIVVVHETTFGNKTSLPDYVADKTKWLPVHPARTHPGSPHMPLFITRDHPPAWVYVGKSWNVTDPEVEITGLVLPEQSVSTLKAAAGVR
ncbi:hypothetical protein EXIGLDRAFT_707197 [Exidia glandulosa HHB12029]|uniref:Uncharacterized protein n=1 Tax=Exidia glandulosa HHB12029 TaxID=1314781 RepID=A0A165JXQ9_EXIGL|nr:hypothetical protein EXIGLDRAFT_707197 [Exidia glandulosa HHB12029]